MTSQKSSLSRDFGALGDPPGSWRSRCFWSSKAENPLGPKWPPCLIGFTCGHHMLIIWRLYSLLCSVMGQFSRSCSVSIAHGHFWSWLETSRYATGWLMRWPFSVGMGWCSSRVMKMGNCRKLIVCFGKQIYATFGGLSRVCLFLHTFPGPFTPWHGRFQVHNPIIVS